MNEQMDGLDRVDEEILATDFSDEALEATASAPDAAQTTIYTAFTQYPLKPCGCAA